MSAHQIFSGAPSTITANSSALEQKKKPLCKRKRTTDAASDTDSTSHTTRTRDGPKKKKANRACFHCQKAHLTCDDCELPKTFPPPSSRAPLDTTITRPLFVLRLGLDGFDEAGMRSMGIHSRRLRGPR
ncbi:hypothetical protein PHLCEN_2v4242 [Hermanssonia centrifuga]|uniref:Zn(2)-C6 fungal-type domain-containing protein n=1 Tax=Hermanssonia centrifuga TaxID=98765 RepID=A0A2R6PZI9_9APHY|nr:hypothetical protein PHLCEN_2v4242 [Hermanssonia centrifuga]